MKLIDADRLLEGIAELKQSPWFNSKYGYADRKEAVETIEDLCIKREPTVDVVSKEKYETSQEVRKILVEFADDLLAELKERVEVVRCEDCKYNGTWCDIQDIEWIEKGKPIEFCSYGERREDDEVN